MRARIPVRYDTTDHFCLDGLRLVPVTPSPGDEPGFVESPDGLTWSQLGLGHGKTRTMTGATGTKVWVRMATIRGELQSDWCTPVLVTIP